MTNSVSLLESNSGYEGLVSVCNALLGEDPKSINEGPHSILLVFYSELITISNGLICPLMTHCPPLQSSGLASPVLCCI